MIGGLLRWLWDWGTTPVPPVVGACVHIVSIASPGLVLSPSSPSIAMTITSPTLTVTAEEC